MFPGGLGLRISAKSASPLDEEGEPLFKGPLAADQYLQKLDFGEDIHQSFVYFVMEGARATAIRKIVVDTPKTEGAFRGAENEVVIYKALQKVSGHGKYLLPFEGSHRGSKTIALDFKYIPGLDLLDYIKQKRPSVGKLTKVFEQAKEALDFCHTNGVLHDDIKLDNFYVDEKGEHCYIFDFGNGYTEEGEALDPRLIEEEQVAFNKMVADAMKVVTVKGGGRRRRFTHSKGAGRTRRSKGPRRAHKTRRT